MDIDIGDVQHGNVMENIHFKLSEGKGKEQEQEEEERIDFKFARNDGHSLLYLGDMSKIEMETRLKQANVAAELFHGRSGEVRVSHRNAQKTRLAIEATLTADYFAIRDRIEAQYHLM